MNLGELRDRLRLCDAASPLYVDNREPAALMSYRGDYSHLAIACKRRRDDYKTEIRRLAAHRDYDPFPAVAEVTIASPVTVAEMLAALQLADGEDFEGYKGGSYPMHARTPIYASEYGEVSRALVSYVEALPGRVDLITREVQW